MPKLITIILISITALGLSNCSRLNTYHHAFQQGNVIEDNQMHALKKGMTKQQVTYIMGSPVLDNMLSKNRWEYVYLVNDGHHDMTQKRVVIEFRRNRVVSIS